MNNTNPSTLNRGRIQGTETALDTRHRTGHEQHEPFYFKPGVYSRDRDSIGHKTQNGDKNKERLAMRIPPIN